jgi:hypothetical protein
MRRASSKSDRSLVAEGDELGIADMVNKAIKVALEAFKVEFERLVSKKFSDVNARIDKLDAENKSLLLLVGELREEMSNQGKSVQTYAQAAQAANASNSAAGNVKEERCFLVAVHNELRDKQRRANNVIIRGLNPDVGKSDADLFEELCESHLPMKPAFVRDSCRRLGKPQAGKTQPLLITLSSALVASDLLACANSLRKALDPAIKTNVFINADLTPAESLAAFEYRAKRRERQGPKSTTATGSDALSASLNATCAEFVPGGDKPSVCLSQQGPVSPRRQAAKGQVTTGI